MNELVERCKKIDDLHDGLEDALKPYVELYSKYVQATKDGANYTFWSYPGPQDRVDYHIDWQYSNSGGVRFEGRDRDGDMHEFVLPYEFIENSKRKADELMEMQMEQERLRLERERVTSREKTERDRETRRQMWLALQKEFGNG